MMMCFKGGRILAFVVGMRVHHKFTVPQRMNMHKNSIVNRKHPYYHQEYACHRLFHAM